MKICLQPSKLLWMFLLNVFSYFCYWYSLVSHNNIKNCIQIANFIILVIKPVIIVKLSLFNCSREHMQRTGTVQQKFSNIIPYYIMAKFQILHLTFEDRNLQRFIRIQYICLCTASHTISNASDSSIWTTLYASIFAVYTIW